MRYVLKLLPNEKLLSIEATGSITFDIGKTYNKTTLKPFIIDGKEEGIYDVVNVYLESLTPPQEQCLLDRLINAKQFIDTYGSGDDFKYVLTDLIDSFFSCKGVTGPDIQSWVNSHIAVPSGIMKVYDSNDETYTRKQTYLQEDYLDLVGLTIMIKMISPIIAEFIYGVSEELTNHAELETLRLLPPCIKEHPGFVKLDIFTKATVNVTNIPSEIIYRSSMSVEILPEYILANVLLSRLISGTILTNTAEKHIITHIHRQLFNRQKVTTSIRMKDKGIGKQFSDDDSDGIGPYDVVRYRENLSKADQVKYAHVGDPTVFIPWLVDAGVLDADEFWTMLPHVLKHSIYIKQIHYTILQSLFLCIIPYKSFILLDKDQMKAFMLAAHLILRESHPYLSLIIISTVAMDDDGQPVPHPMVTRSRLSRELTTALVDRHPVNIVGSAKHPTKVLIEDMSRQLIETWLILTYHKHLSVELHSYMNNNQVIVREDGKKCIAEFMLGIDELLTRPTRNIPQG